MKHNIVFIMVDQWNHTCFGWKQHPVVKTPQLDALRSDSVDFETTYCQNGICMPSRVSYLTGQYLFTHREYGFSGLLAEDAPNLYRFFRDNGYETLHSGKGHINSAGDDLGFETFIPTLPEDIWLATDPSRHYQAFCRKKNHAYPTDQIHGMDFDSKTRAHLVVTGKSDIPLEESLERYTSDRAIEFIERPHAKPFFVNVSFDRPHHPLTPSGKYAELYSPDDIPLGRIFTEQELAQFPVHLQNYLRNHPECFTKAGERGLKKLLAQYYGLMTHIDDEIGRVVAALKEKNLYENTAIVFCSDHGDFAGHGGGFEKFANQCYRDQIVRVPLLLKYPREKHRGKTVAVLAETIDLFPTLAGLCELSVGALDIEGRDLTPFVEGKPDSRNTAFSEAYAIKMIRVGDFKLIYYVNSKEGELYDLASDPGEFRNLFEESAFQQKRLELKLALVKKLTPEPGEQRKAFIRRLLSPWPAERAGEMEPLYKWDKWIDEGGGFWLRLKGEYRFTYVPFDNRAVLEKILSTDTDRRTVETVDEPKIMESFIDEILNYISTKIRPLSAMSGSPQHKENLLTTRGAGLI